MTSLMGLNSYSAPNCESLTTNWNSYPAPLNKSIRAPFNPQPRYSTVETFLAAIIQNAILTRIQLSGK